MAKRVTSLRISEGLLAWADSYAEQRGSSRTAVVETALQNLRDIATAGVPDLEQASGEQAAPRRTGQSGSSPAPARVPQPKNQFAEWARIRQEKLNDAKYGRKR